MVKKADTLLKIGRHFTNAKQSAYDAITWRRADAKLVNAQTQAVIFEQKNLEFPTDWSQNAINIVAQKYFTGEAQSAKREYSLKQLIDRVVTTIASHGVKEGYFKGNTDSQTFTEELRYILATQRASFNSPVWFNIGVPSRPQQASACFILSVDDTITSILDWYKEEGLIFKGGSGSGINLSSIRSSLEGLSDSVGNASGPVSFMRGADASAGSIRSGGKTRRAAKMVILNADHPDIEEFITCKSNEERKAHALAQAGFDMSLNGADIFNIQYQNANNSVRVSDDFMRAVEDDADWHLKATGQKLQGQILKTVRARQLFRQIAQAAWECADPGLQFDDTINDWHTTPVAGRINASNPCSEYMHLDNSACNLASINLLKFIDNQGHFQIEDFKHTVTLMLLAQEILVGYSDYPTKKIGATAKAYRQLGLGYANLGALLMSQGLPYDSDAGRAQAATLTALMTGQAYVVSAQIAHKVGTFQGYEQDAKGTIRVLKKHRSAVKKIDASSVAEDLLTATTSVWEEAVHLAEAHGVRNAQVSVLAPTGTIGLMMDCDTTGIEPDLSLVKFKTLVGGGQMKFVNQTVSAGLASLGYNEAQIKVMTDYIEEKHTLLNAPHFQSQHAPVFACAIGDNMIEPIGHVRMMAAVQPFLSGAISKTVNMPNETSVAEVESIYQQAWRLGVKAIAIYRDNCKVAQPVSTQDKSDQRLGDSLPDFEDNPVLQSGFASSTVARREMPNMRSSKTFKFKIASTKGFVTVGEYEDGTPGEIFIVVAKQGSTLAGIMDALAISVSHGLQYGVPLQSYIRAFMSMSFAPNGMTDDPDIRMATSFVDYIFRKLAKTYLTYDEQVELGIIDFAEQARQESETQTKLLEEAQKSEVASESAVTFNLPEEPESAVVDLSGPLCVGCGNPTQRAGACYICRVCGLSTGCS